MKNIHLISGLPRSGSTLLCNLLNLNQEFHATPTSGVLDILKAIRSNFSHNVSWKAQDRLSLLNNFKEGLKGFLNGFYYDKKIVFDKCRSWTNNISLLDEIKGNKDTKIIWTYRDPVEIISSIESRYQETLLIENVDESQIPNAFSTLEDRITTFANEGGIVYSPIRFLKDAIEMGYRDRILIVSYHDITNHTQQTLDRIHDFIGEKRFTYDVKQLRQNTFEYDGIYNYKFMHNIKEGGIKWKKANIILPQKYINFINEKFRGLNKFIFDNNPDELLGITFEDDGTGIIPGVTVSKPIEEVIKEKTLSKKNPFKI